MKINLGLDSSSIRQESPRMIIWDSTKVINPHMLVVGKTGTGKTHTIKKIINEMLTTLSPGKKLRIRVIDVHGDIDVPNASSIKFSETSEYGFNPLAINPDKDFGGVRKKIQSFISIINKTSRKLGTRQEPALRNILRDLYAANGFYENDYRSWSLYDSQGNHIMINGRPKKFPTLEDAYRYANFKQNAMFLGSNNKTTLLLEKTNKLSKKMFMQQKKFIQATDSAEKEAAQQELESTGNQSIEAYTEYIKSIETGRELDDLIKYDSLETIKSIVNRLEGLISSGIFKNRTPDFDPRASVWRYNIQAISDYDEKKLFVYFLLEDIYLKCFQDGMKDEVVEMVFLDESNLFFSDESDNIINIIAKEARKFGMGLCCASQSPTHFSEDFISSVATKIVLGIDQFFWNSSVQKLKMDQKGLEWIIPQKRLLAQISNKGELKNNYSWIIIK